MEYLPGNIHESLRKVHVFELINDFNVPILNKRYSESNLVDDDSTKTLELLKNDILFIRFFKPIDKYGTTPSYTFINKLIRNVVEYEIMNECTLSKEFVILNSKNGILFNDVTKIYERDNKLKQILNDL